jgi:hypothetical protein
MTLCLVDSTYCLGLYKILYEASIFAPENKP